ncbi:MAG TPA: GvpL/GvpF family gas vesicle protein [Thermoanaerobaculia bacterium]|nr:GvpL/GvpF family gas vesicle protein [Thermoanaerobaculia bacterium]
MSRSTATYVYCLVRSAAPPSLEGAPDGLPGAAPPRLLPLDGLWLVVADAPLPEYGGDAIESRLSDLSWVSDRALAHESVVEHFAAAVPVLPMKLFTLFHGDERAVAHLQEQREEIGKIFDRIAGRVEWGVRILFREDEARRRAAAAAAGEGERPTSGTTSGTSFLLRKKAEKESVRDLTTGLRAEVDRAYEELASRAVEARRRQPEPGEAGARLLLDAAFLVPAGEDEAFDAAVQRLAERLAERSCEVTLTGPWPPYNFLGALA